MAIPQEALMTTTEFKRPKVLKDKAVIYTLLVRLALLEPGTNQTHPEMGLGLKSKYRYTFASDLSAITNDYRKQIETYLPEFKLSTVKASVKDHCLFLEVAIDESVYQMYINTETYTLENMNA